MKYFLAIFITAFLSVAGTYYFLKNPVPVSSPAPAPAPAPLPVPSPAPAPSADPHADWTLISPGGVVELKIPPSCLAGGAAGSTFITCPTVDNPTPTPEMAISSDGIQVNIRRWEGLAGWKYWDEVLSTLTVKTPLSHTVKISIEK